MVITRAEAVQRTQAIARLFASLPRSTAHVSTALDALGATVIGPTDGDVRLVTLGDRYVAVVGDDHVYLIESSEPLASHALALRAYRETEYYPDGAPAQAMSWNVEGFDIARDDAEQHPSRPKTRSDQPTLQPASRTA